MPDFANMTEEEQIAFAMQMSMQDARKYLKNFKHSRISTLKFKLSRRTNHPTSQAS